jgi:hypothetical protein
MANAVDRLLAWKDSAFPHWASHHEYSLHERRRMDRTAGTQRPITFDSEISRI